MTPPTQEATARVMALLAEKLQECRQWQDEHVKRLLELSRQLLTLSGAGMAFLAAVPNVGMRKTIAACLCSSALAGIGHLGMQMYYPWLLTQRAKAMRATWEVECQKMAPNGQLTPVDAEPPRGLRLSFVAQVLAILVSFFLAAFGIWLG